MQANLKIALSENISKASTRELFIFEDEGGDKRRSKWANIMFNYVNYEEDYGVVMYILRSVVL